MNSAKNEYKGIVKATSLFGGVQVFTIIIGIIRSKIVAVLLGTTGVGVLNLLIVTRSLIMTVTGLGLASSAVRDISEANGTGDIDKISYVLKTFRRWILLTGFSSFLISLILSPYLSLWTFGNRDYSWAFAWLSVTCLLAAIASGQSVLLQGLRKLRQMAVSSVIGSILGLLTSVPLYYYYGIKGIVPSLIISSVCSLIVNYYFSRLIYVKNIRQTWAETWTSGKGMVKLGFVMMLNGLMITIVSYIVNLYIGNHGGISEVGLYNSGWTITNQYTALIFTAMGTDYFPKLSAINSDTKKLKTAVNQQAEIAVLIMGPMLVLLIGFASLVVYILYTDKFMPITGMIKWNMLGMLFKASSWAMAFTIIAKGDNKIFFITETSANMIILALNLLGYYLFGLSGIGISFTVSYIIYFTIILYVVKKRYSVTYDNIFLKLFSIQLLLVITTFILALFFSSYYIYVISGFLFAISVLFSLYEMHKRLDLRIILNLFGFKK
ncbi:MAG TPA: O-antigen translocase [Spirochaetota bacterium]|nr:O-antigen translocase [Spirochaetota bacterium]